MQKEDNKGYDFLKETKKNPFKVPDGYFDTLEDRLFARIETKEEPLSVRKKIIRILKPALALTASFILIYLLVYYPILYLLPDKFTANVEQPVKTEESFDMEELTSMDEGLFYTALISDEDAFFNNQIIKTDEVVDYLVAELNDFDLYSEIQNQ